MRILRPGCKINLGLEITGRLPNGFHALKTFYYPLSWPADELRVRQIPGKAFQLACNNAGLASDSNLIKLAWGRFGEKTGIWRGYSVNLKKRIPIGAGLGGGSSDAACFLDFLNESSGFPLNQRELLEIAFTLGADVPFFLMNTPCMATGAGERLQPADFESHGFWVVLVSPGIEARTAAVFRVYDEICENARHRPDCLTNELTGSKENNSDWAECLENDLELAACKLWPQLRRLNADLIAAGAGKAAMSGSGSSFYGIFDQAQAARKAADLLRKTWPLVYVIQLRDFGM